LLPRAVKNVFPVFPSSKTDGYLFFEYLIA
jgi:hypothetical protein